MKTIILYNSVHHGNTEKIAVSMAGAMNADIMKLDDADKFTIRNYDIVGFGSGIFFKKHHKQVFTFIDTLTEAVNKKAFVFSTSGTGEEEFNEPLVSVLKEKGFEVVGSFTCKGYDTWGPFKIIGGIAKGKPDKTDMENAMIFSKSLLTREQKLTGGHV